MSKDLFEKAAEAAGRTAMAPGPANVPDRTCESRMDAQEGRLRAEIVEAKQEAKTANISLRSHVSWRTLLALMTVATLIIGVCYTVAGLALSRTAQNGERLATAQAERSEIMRSLDRVEGLLHELKDIGNEKHR